MTWMKPNYTVMMQGSDAVFALHWKHLGFGWGVAPVAMSRTRAQALYEKALRDDARSRCYFSIVTVDEYWERRKAFFIARKLFGEFL